MPVVRLTHHCGRQSCSGFIGDVMSVPREDADWLVAIGGGVILSADHDPQPEQAAIVNKPNPVNQRRTEQRG